MNPAQLFQMGAQQQVQAAQQSVPVQQNANAWKCTCGATATGKFCPECGAKKPETQPTAGWTCACGAVNAGRFCSECGAKRPAGAPVYRCDKCGWQPKTPCTRRNFVLSAAIHSTRMTVCDHRIGKKVYRVTSLRRRLTDCYEDRGACGLPDYQRVSNHVFLFAFQFAKLMGLYRVTLRKAQQRKHRTLSCPACHCSRLIDTGDSTQSRTICPGETGYEQADYYQKCHGCGTEIGITKI